MIPELETLIGLVLSPLAIIAAGAAVAAIALLIIIDGVFDMVERG